MALPLLLFLAACGGGLADSSLPALTYRYASLAVPNATVAADFFKRFTGAELVPRSSFLIEAGETEVVGCRLYYADRQQYSDVYFQSTAGSSLPGAESISTFSELVSKGHSMANDDWDWWQDWHLAFYVSDLDAVALNLMKNDVPFVSRGSLYFEIANTGLIIQVLGNATVYWKEPFLFCRKTDNAGTGRMQPYKINVTDISSVPSKPLPEFIPSHQSMYASDAVENALWTYKFLNVTKLDTLTKPTQSHAYANGTCANIQWMAVENFWSLHYIQQKFKREGLIRIKEHEKFVNELHGDLSEIDAYMGYRAALSVPSLTPYIENFKVHEEPILMLGKGGKRLLIKAPNGYIIELFEDTAYYSRRMMEGGSLAYVPQY